MCAFRLLLLRVAYSHKEHLKGFTPTRGEKNNIYRHTHTPILNKAGPRLVPKRHTLLPRLFLPTEQPSLLGLPGLHSAACSDFLQDMSWLPYHGAQSCKSARAVLLTAHHHSDVFSPACPLGLGPSRAQTLSSVLGRCLFNSTELS